MGSDHTTFAYACPSLYNKPRFSYVAVSGIGVRERVMWYAQVVAFLEFDLKNPTGRGEFSNYSN